MTIEVKQEWVARPERGVVPVMKAVVWLALHAGRRVARLVLWPGCLYYLLASGESRAASRDYLGRALGRPAGWRDILRQYHAFASVVLDRIFLLNDQTSLFDVTIHGEQIVKEIAAKGEGCLLFGAHLGSFEVLRAVGRHQPNLKVSILMYEDNARKINSVLNAINPALEMDVISLGRSNSLIAVEDRLNHGHFVGVLADRGLECERTQVIPFMGQPAGFPDGPFRMASMLGRPVVLMFGLYRGGNRYEIHFERLSFTTAEEAMARYVARLEYFCRDAPYNWFNFYHFWKS
jgi:predicted LPLAT superfamily acyltransferase